MVSVLIPRTAGTNCDQELTAAFKMASAEVSSIHINELIQSPRVLERHAILAIAGGFSYGDDIASGRILANQLVNHLAEPIRQFVDRGGLVLGVCNGFQVLVKCGLLPGGPANLGVQTATLTYNTSGQFECRWSKLAVPTHTRCIWCRDLSVLALPVAHGEGRFAAPPDMLEQLATSGQIALQYVGDDHQPTSTYPANPNGSAWGIAGVCDPSGRVFGLMPHPERFASWLQAPAQLTGSGDPPGLKMLHNAVRAAAAA